MTAWEEQTADGLTNSFPALKKFLSCLTKNSFPALIAIFYLINVLIKLIKLIK